MHRALTVEPRLGYRVQEIEERFGDLTLRNAIYTVLGVVVVAVGFFLNK